MRPLISYDDITTPPIVNSETPAQIGPQTSSAHQRPAKRRKSNQKTSQRRAPPPQHVQHWDDPNPPAQDMRYVDDGNNGGRELNGAKADEEEGEVEDEGGCEEEVMSRELTHGEIWDDSALIDAWNSATAEYEAFHGKGKQWKEEPVKKSPLWYNVPPPSAKSKVSTVASNSSQTGAAQQQNDVVRSQAEVDSEPLNFDTFVPTHDPSLADNNFAAPPHPPGAPGPDYGEYYLPNPPGPLVSQDEAFQRALSAMYWGGYWTAVYHCQRQPHASSQSINDGSQENGDGEGDSEVDMGDFVSAQR